MLIWIGVQNRQWICHAFFETTCYRQLANNSHTVIRRLLGPTRKLLKLESNCSLHCRVMTGTGTAIHVLSRHPFPYCGHLVQSHFSVLFPGKLWTCLSTITLFPIIQQKWCPSYILPLIPHQILRFLFLFSDNIICHFYKYRQENSLTEY